MPPKRGTAQTRKSRKSRKSRRRIRKRRTLVQKKRLLRRTDRKQKGGGNKADTQSGIDAAFGRGVLNLEGEERIEGGLAGSIWKASYNGKEVAVKIITPRNEPAHKVAIEKELEALKAMVDERNVLQYIHHFPEIPDPNKNFYIITELCGTDLFDYFLKEGNNLTKLDILNIMHQILTGLDSIHKKGWIHGDMKIENICVTHDGRVIKRLAILDFGFAVEHKGDGMVENVGQGTYIYIAPEQVGFSKPTHNGMKSDVFSSGTIFYILIFGGYAFTSKVKKSQPTDLTDALRARAFKSPHSKKTISRDTLVLLSEMLSIDPRRRPLPDKALQRLKQMGATPAPDDAARDKVVPVKAQATRDVGVKIDADSHEELKREKISSLRHKANRVGATPLEMEEAEDADDVKDAMIALIVEYQAQQQWSEPGPAPPERCRLCCC